MVRQPVSSSNLRSVGYDPVNMVLEIEFHSGAVYQYRGVPLHTHAGLMGAGSHGTYFHMYIKNAYSYTRVA